jgi:5,10-methylenetetrahydromethanopterin reductase
MQIGLRIPPCAPVTDVADFCRNAEEAGVNVLWFPDSQLLWRDPYISMALAAQSTEKAVLATGVTNLKTRHLSVLASLARTLQELAPGRIAMGVGAGASSTKPLGIPLATSRELREGITLIRALLAGNTVKSQSGLSIHMEATFGICPIYLAATGPKRLRLAGEIADGTILHAGTTKEVLTPSLEAITAGARAFDREPSQLQTIVSAVTVPGADISEASKQLMPICVTMYQDGGADLLSSIGITIAERARSPVNVASFDFKHASSWTTAIEMASTLVTPEDASLFAHHFAFAGTNSQIAKKLTDLEELGISQVMFQGLSSTTLPWELLDLIRTIKTQSD